MLDLPRPLLWADRAASMPYIKGGGDAQLESLRSLLLAIDRDPADIETVQAVDRSRPRGFAERAARGVWKVSDNGRKWLESGDDAFLMGVLHSEIRFVGELLEQLESGPLSHSQLVDIARTEYDLPWNSMDQVRRRTTWFRAAGFLELRFDNYLLLTESGGELLRRFENRPPASASNPSRFDTSPVVLPDAHPSIDAFLTGLTQADLRGRRRLVGYMPGGNSGIDAIRSLVSVATPKVSRAEWIDACGSRFSIIESSASQAIGSFRTAGLLEQISREDDSSTDLARAWLESDEDLDLIRLLHGKIRFFGELLSFMQTTGSAADLAAKALQFKIPPADLQRRLGLFMAARLVEEAGVRRFRLTPLGEALAGALPLEDDSLLPPEVGGETSSANVDSGVSKTSVITEELRSAARAAHDYKRFERAIAVALAELGFAVEHIGGQGRTDVRAISPLPGDQRFVLIADAKASAKGQVAPFDVVTLREHKEQHAADAVVAVGEAFADRRTVDRAKTEGVGLLSVDALCHILHACSEGIIGIDDIRKIFSTPGRIAEDAITSAARSNRRLNSIASSVLSALAAEAASNDEVMKGGLSASEMYILLRSQESSPSLKDISVILELISGPFVRGVASRGDKYVLCEHVPIIVARLQSLATSFSAAATTESMGDL